MTETRSPRPPRVLPDHLTEGFLKLGLSDGDSVVMHASLSSMGLVDGGAAMVLHRLLKVIGKSGTLLMPTFTSKARHASTHDYYTKAGCWCQGNENRHVPFIPELQPDAELGEIAFRLCSWPASRRSGHPAFSFVATGKSSDELVREYSLTDPLQPLKIFLKQAPLILTIGAELDSVFAIHLAEENRVPSKFLKERALTVTSKGLRWVEVVAAGCSKGYPKLAGRVQLKDVHEVDMGLAKARLYSMKEIVAGADQLLGEDPLALNCGRPGCLSCVSFA